MLLERDGDLALLGDLLAGLDASGGKVVLLRGEAGIGKSSLVREFVDRIAGEAHVYVGFCDDLLTPQAFGPFWDIARQEPSLETALRDDDRPGVLGIVLDLLSRSLRPNVMVIEDTHWADEATLDAVKFLGRRVARTNGLLLLTYRDGEVDYDHPLRGAIGDLPPTSVTRMQLGGLSLASVAAIIEGSELDPEVVMAATNGNPFLVSETATTRGDVVPESIQDSVMARVNRLPPGVVEFLRFLAVIPEPVPAAEWRLLPGASDDSVASASRVGLLDAGSGFVAFRHELIRRAVEATLSPNERVDHNRAVLAILPPGTDPARIAHHAREAKDFDRLLEAAPAAARAAAAVDAHREAVSHFRQLAEHIDRLEVAVRGPFLDAWAESEFRLDNNNEAIELTEMAISHYQEVEDPSGESGALIQAAHYCEIVGERKRCEQFAEKAVSVLGSKPSGNDLARALEINAFVQIQASNVSATTEFVDRATAADGVDDVWLQIRLLNHRGVVADLINYPDGRGSLDDARRLAEGAGEWYEEARALANIAWTALENRDLPTAADYAKRAVASSAQHQLVTMEAYASAIHATVLALGGEFETAADAAGELDTNIDGSRGAMYKAVAIPVLAVVEARTGRSISDALLRVWDAFGKTDEFQRIGPAAMAVAELAWISGSSEVSVADLRYVMDMGLDRGLSWSAGSIAFWLWKLGELEAVPAGIAEPYRLVIEGNPLAAAEMWKKLGCPYERAIALSHGDSTAQLQALSLFDTLGATAVAAKLRKTMRGQGIAVPRGKGRATRGHRAGLTARQAEVLELLAEGLTNIEIADRLFLSLRTVQNHVAAILMKLDVTSRDAAVDAARDRGALATP